MRRTPTEISTLIDNSPEMFERYLPHAMAF
jgi:hypothetical protein